MPQLLHHTLVTADDRESDRWLYVLHGVYGMGRNWGSIARRLVDAEPRWGAVLVDLRLHGDSQGFEPPHTVAAAAADLERLIADTERPAATVLGHSFGGKVALQHAADASRPPAQVWVIDSTPDTREPSGTAWEMIEVLRSLPSEVESRGEAVQGVMEHGLPRTLAQWLAMNVQPEDGRYRWRLDPDALEEMLRDFFALDLWPVVQTPPEDTELHFVKANDSDTLEESAAERIERLEEESGRVHLHRIDGGHWLNADNPDGLLKLLTARLP